MNREETLALYEQGVEAWNKWANEMLEERKRLEEAGEWVVEYNTMEDVIPLNEKTKKWINRTTANFSSKEKPSIFKEKFNIENFIFPSITYFEKAQFLKEVNFNNSRFNGISYFRSTMFKDVARFNNCVFEDIKCEFSEFNKSAEFHRCIFNREVHFLATLFSSNTDFSNTVFKKDTYFLGASFNGYTSFGYSTFKRTSFFSGSTFKSETYFNETLFVGHTVFENCIFNEFTFFEKSIFSKSVVFNNSKFEYIVSFNAVKFEGISSYYNATITGKASFEAVFAESAFTLEKALFKNELPNFIQANFKEAPRLDNIEIAKNILPGKFLNSITTHIPTETKASYQALKRIAIQAHDHENEQRFWAGELRSDRSLRTEDGGWKLRPLVSAFWWGNIAYEFFSDYGRSIVRPLFSLFILLCIMTNIHIYAHYTLNKEPISTSKTKTHTTKQSDLKDCDIRSSAFRVAAKNGAIGLLQNPAKRSTFVRDYTCLYGTYNDNATPKIPNSIFWIELFHTLFSAILIFLTLLGIRNNFKLK